MFTAANNETPPTCYYYQAQQYVEMTIQHPKNPSETDVRKGKEHLSVFVPGQPTSHGTLTPHLPEGLPV